MNTIQMKRLASFACVSAMMSAAVGCVGDSEESADVENEIVETGEQALITDGQQCVIVQRGTAGEVEDAILWQTAPTWNDGASERIAAGNSSEGGHKRSLLRFDLSAVPAGANVVSADLTLTQTYKDGPSATVDILRATGAWSEETVTSESFGDAFDPTPVASFTAEGDGGLGERTVDVRGLAQDWVRGAPNHGVLIDAPTDTTLTELRSSESPYADERPALEVCYTTCHDGVKNGEETGVDCGGPSCGSCTVYGSFTYSHINTNSAMLGTDRGISLRGGMRIAIGTCGIGGAWAIRDTYLRLFDPNGVQVASNDDACGDFSSYMTYTVPANAGGIYTIRAGCFGMSSCSGNVVYVSY
jgi:hypothetical protein